jgi:hypothetical protein
MSLIKLRLDISNVMSKTDDYNYSGFSTKNFAKEINLQFGSLQVSARVIKYVLL